MSDGQLAPAERRHREADLDRVEDRFYDAPEGMHILGEAIDESQVVAAGVPARHAMLWARWNGLQIGLGGTAIEPVESHAELTSEALGAQLIAEGDWVVGSVGRELLVLPADPWEDGADVLLVGEDGQRGPYASTVERLVLAAMAESSVLYDEDGEYREGAFDEERDELIPSVRRQMIRRRLDLDPDAPLPRFELAQSLLAEGSPSAAARELRGVLERAPNFCWAHHELGRALWAMNQESAPESRRGAIKAHREAAKLSHDAGLRAYFLAWACVAAKDEEILKQLVEELLKQEPGFATMQLRAARELIEDGDLSRARVHVQLGRAVAPTNLELIDLSRQLPED